MDQLEFFKSNPAPNPPREPPSQVPIRRSIKIEAGGDFWRGLVKPKIRLMGRWLERAGFNSGDQVQVLCVRPGVLELRCHDALVLNKERYDAIPSRNCPF